MPGSIMPDAAVVDGGATARAGLEHNAIRKNRIVLYAEGIPLRGPVPGAYTHPSTHPWIFTTRSELEDTAQRNECAQQLFGQSS